MRYAILNKENRVQAISSFTAEKDIYIDVTELDISNSTLIHLKYNPETSKFEEDEEYKLFHDRLNERVEDKKNPEDYVSDVKREVGIFLDSTAQQYDYDSILSAVSYVESTDTTYKTEALAFISWRDVVWNETIDHLNSVAEDSSLQMNPQEFIATLPQINIEYPVDTANT